MLLFLKGAGGWLVRNPGAVMVTLLSVAFVMIVISKNSEIRTLRSTIVAGDKRYDQTVAALAQARTNVATLNAALVRQNFSLITLQKQNEANGVKFDGLIANMAGANATTVRKLDAIDKAQPGADLCKSAFELMKEAAR